MQVRSNVCGEVATLICLSRASARVLVACHDVNLVEHNFYVDTGMALTWNWMMVIQDMLAVMSKGGKSRGKVHYVRIEVSTAFWGIMVLRVFRRVVGLLITDVSKERTPFKGQGVKSFFFLIPQEGLL